MNRATVLPAGAIGLALAVLAVVVATRGPQAQGGPAEPAAPPASRGSPLDDLPEHAMPFLHYTRPERLFFTTPNEYRGPGRASTELEGDAEVRMGLLAPLDGPAKAYGIEMQRGAELAVKERNEKGGVRGKPVRLFSRDDKGTMSDAANGAVALIHDDRVVAILGTVHSGNTHVLARVALKCETPMLTSISTDPTISQHSIPWTFRCLVDDQPQGRAIAKYVFETKRYTKVCTMWFNNKYGRMGIQELRNIARRLGHPVLYDLSFNPGDTDFTSQLTKVKESGAEALVLWGLYKEIAGIVRQARAMGLPAELVGGDGFVSQAFLEAAGPAAEGVVATYPYDVDAKSPQNVAFVEAFTRAYGHAPDSFGAHGYDAMNVLLAAVEQGGQNRARVRDALAVTTDFPGVTGPITFDNVGNDKRKPPLARVVGGRFVPVAD
ncbi:MAG: ABC transporter substrate-binding protein [Planctomycetes bacterium]|nr:ABC transporter substrate-binding protein [Planctomycetota bacterium]